MISPFPEHRLDRSPGDPFDLTRLPTHGGVYLVEDTESRPILLSFGENLRRIVSTRLAAAAPDVKTRRVQLGDIAARIRWVGTFSRFETAWVHWRIQRELEPQTYRRQLAFPPAWFASIRLEDKIPRFVATRDMQPGGARHIGPFPTRRAAEDWVHMLEDAFDLCRYHDILEQVPHGVPCAYHEMGRCAAPCNGSVPMPDYVRSLRDALNFSIDGTPSRPDELRVHMQHAARDLAFERAATLRTTLDRIDSARNNRESRFIADADDARWLIVQNAPRPKRSAPAMRPFRFHGGVLRASETVTLGETASAADAWLRELHESRVSPLRSRDEARERSEAFGLLTKFLFQEERAPGVFIRVTPGTTPEEIHDALVKRFVRAPEKVDSCDDNQPVIPDAKDDCTD